MPSACLLFDLLPKWLQGLWLRCGLFIFSLFGRKDRKDAREERLENTEMVVSEPAKKLGGRLPEVSGWPLDSRVWYRLSYRDTIPWNLCPGATLSPHSGQRAWY